MRMFWVWLLVASIVGLAWWGFVVQVVLGIPWGTRPAPDTSLTLIAIGMGVVLPVFFLALRLETVVGADALDLRYVPLRHRRIPFGEISSARAVTYHPIREYGGWGLRWWFSRGWAWTVQGHRGVRLQLADGRRLLVGSADPDAFVRALAEGGVETET